MLLIGNNAWIWTGWPLRKWPLGRLVLSVPLSAFAQFQMAAARVASSSKTTTSYFNQQQPPTRVTMGSPPPRRISNFQSPSATSSAVGRSVSSRSPSRHSGVALYRRCLLFLLNAEVTPEFPFCEQVYQAHSRIRWPPWPHRLDPGHPKVFVRFS